MLPVNRDPSPRLLRQFGVAWLVLVAALGVVARLRWGMPRTALVLWIAALAVPGIGWLAPRFMRLVYLGLSYLTWPVGFVVGHVAMAVVYYLVVTPVGLVMRLVGRDPMERRLDRGAGSYWKIRPAAGDRSVRRYFQQF